MTRGFPAEKACALAEGFFRVPRLNYGMFRKGVVTLKNLNQLLAGCAVRKLAVSYCLSCVGAKPSGAVIDIGLWRTLVPFPPVNSQRDLQRVPSFQFPCGCAIVGWTPGGFMLVSDTKARRLKRQISHNGYPPSAGEPQKLSCLEGRSLRAFF